MTKKKQPAPKRTDCNCKITCGLEEPAVAVEPFTEQVDTEIANPNHHKTTRGQNRGTTTLPTLGDPRMEISCKYQPGNQGPGFFRVPAPVRTPSFVSPHSPRNNTNGEQREAQTNNSIADIV